MMVYEQAKTAIDNWYANTLLKKATDFSGNEMTVGRAFDLRFRRILELKQQGQINEETYKQLQDSYRLSRQRAAPTVAPSSKAPAPTTSSSLSLGQSQATGKISYRK